MNNKIKYWTDLSDYDLDTADVMLQGKRYLYVGFMCHQAIEKIFKALFIKNKQGNVPFSHSLSYIAKNGEFYDGFSEDQKDFIDQVEPLNIEARYPSHKDRLMKSLNEDKCKEILIRTKKMQQWIKVKL